MPQSVPRAAVSARSYAAGAHDPADWERYFIAIRRHPLFVACIVVIGTLAGIVATGLFEDRYAAHAVLWIEPDNPDRQATALGPDAIVEPEGWIDLVRSQTVLGPVVRRLRLYIHPTDPQAAAALRDFRAGDNVQDGEYTITVNAAGTYTLQNTTGQTVDEGTIGDSIGQSVGFEWAPAPEDLPSNGSVAFGVRSPYEESLRLAEALEVSLDPGGSFVRVGLKGENRARVSATLNGVAERVVVVAADLKRDKLEALTGILAERHGESRQALREAEAELSAFRVRTVDAAAAGGPPIVGGDDGAVGGPVAEQAFEWRVDLDELGRERAALERALRAAPDQGVQIGALSALPSVQTSPPLQLALDELTQKHAEMRALRNRYREASAPVQELQESIDRLSQQTIPALVDQLVAQLRERESDLAPRVDSAFGNLRRVPTLSLQQARLAREVAAAERLYADVRDRFENAQLELASSVPDVQVLDPAVEPQRPLDGFAPLVIALAFLTSLGVAIVAATIWDQRDPKVRYPNQVTRGLRMDIVGAVPHVSRRSRRGTASEMEIIESVRALRHRVQQARSPDGALTLTVTSPGVGDGKSFVSLNLALSFAYAGYRTLLVDGDVRRGGQHRALDVPLQPGLTDVLTDRAPIELAVRGTAYANLSIMPAGTRMHRAPELLESQELRDVLTRLRLTYAVIIVDSPPLQAGIDPLVLTTATVNGVLVMRAGSTEIPSTLSKLDYLDSLPVRMLGVVLNDVRDGSAFREYTYDLRGYELPDEDRPQLLGGRR